jgi:hypothetical protein
MNTIETFDPAQNLIDFELHGIDRDAWLAHPTTSEILLARDWAAYFVSKNPTNEKTHEFAWANIANLIDVTADIDSGKITMDITGRAAVLLHNVRRFA